MNKQSKHPENSNSHSHDIPITAQYEAIYTYIANSYENRQKNKQNHSFLSFPLFSFILILCRSVCLYLFHSHIHHYCHYGYCRLHTSAE